MNTLKDRYKSFYRLCGCLIFSAQCSAILRKLFFLFALSWGDSELHEWKCQSLVSHHFGPAECQEQCSTPTRLPDAPYYSKYCQVSNLTTCQSYKNYHSEPEIKYDWAGAKTGDERGGLEKRQVCKLLSTVWTGDDYDQLILCLPL